MASYIERGDSLFIPFRNGASISDSQCKPSWKCSKCHTKNDNLGMGDNINPYIFSGSKFCPQCGAVMKQKEKDK